MFFITGCCEARGPNQLCHAKIGKGLLDAAQFYHEGGAWFVRLLLLMPDHFHALIAPAPDKTFRATLGDWKRFSAVRQGIAWQKNFIDHRLRSNESWEEKAHYIRTNPVRAGLINEGEKWPYLIEN